MLNWLLKRIVPLPRMEDMESFLFIGPHPDDIEVGCAPTAAKLAGEGKRVSFLIVTDGCMGALDPELYGERLAALRQGEARASAKLLGAAEVAFLPFRDGGMYPVEEAAAAIAGEIARIRPDCVLVTDPDARSECHMDHIKTGLAAKAAMNIAPFRPLMESLGLEGAHQPKAIGFYNTDRPNRYVAVGKTFSAREEALRLHASQFDEASIRQITLYHRLRSVCLGLRRCQGKCDSYRMMAPVHSHCFPEASRW